MGKGGATFGLLIFDLIHSGPVVARNRARIFARKRETGNGKEIIKAADTIFQSCLVYCVYYCVSCLRPANISMEYFNHLGDRGRGLETNLDAPYP